MEPLHLQTVRQMFVRDVAEDTDELTRQHRQLDDLQHYCRTTVHTLLARAGALNCTLDIATDLLVKTYWEERFGDAE
jgi:hypothetical protein